MRLELEGALAAGTSRDDLSLQRKKSSLQLSYLHPHFIPQVHDRYRFQGIFLEL